MVGHTLTPLQWLQRGVCCPFSLCLLDICGCAVAGCYANALLQILHRTMLIPGACPHGLDSSKCRLVCALRAVWAALRDGSSPHATAKLVMRVRNSFLDSMQIREPSSHNAHNCGPTSQHDPTELLGVLFQCPSPEMAEQLQRFNLRTRQTLRCSKEGCGYRSVADAHDPILRVSVPYVAESGVRPLSSVLSAALSEEPMEADFGCSDIPKGERHGNLVYKSSQLIRLPQTLIVELTRGPVGRFEFDRVHLQPVSIPQHFSVAAVRPAADAAHGSDYTLFAILARAVATEAQSKAQQQARQKPVAAGDPVPNPPTFSKMAGHYYAWINISLAESIRDGSAQRRPDQWVELEDRIVKAVTWDEVEREAQCKAYLLFYAQNDSIPPLQPPQAVQHGDGAAAAAPAEVEAAGASPDEPMHDRAVASPASSLSSAACVSPSLILEFGDVPSIDPHMAAARARAATFGGPTSSSSGDGRRVAVVGAGPAGLTAATLLAHAGFDVHLLEARPEVGGRVQHVRFTEQILVNTGATFIAAVQPQQSLCRDCENRFYAQVERCHGNFRPFEDKVRLAVYQPGGQWETNEVKGALRKWEDIDQTFLERAKNLPPGQDRPQHEAIQELIDEEKDPWLRSFFVARYISQIGYCAQASELSLRDICQSTVAFEGEHLFADAGAGLYRRGFQLLLLPYIRYLDQCARVSLFASTAVTSVQWEAGADALHKGVVLRTCDVPPEVYTPNDPTGNATTAEMLRSDRDSKHSTTCHYDFVVITVPVAVLPTIRFQPELPQSKQQALERIGMGIEMRVLLSFRSCFWEPTAALLLPLTGESDLSRDPAPWRFVCHTRALESAASIFDPEDAPEVTAHILVAVASPQHARTLADEAWSRERVIADALAILSTHVAPAATNVSTELVDACVTSWHDDPWTRGSYAFLRPNASESDVDALASPMGRVHFAGEATHFNGLQWANGAQLSGERAAQDIMSDNNSGTRQRPAARGASGERSRNCDAARWLVLSLCSVKPGTNSIPLPCLLPSLLSRPMSLAPLVCGAARRSPLGPRNASSARSPWSS